MATIQKPHGRLGELYDAVSTYTTDPRGEIERIAQKLLGESIIDRNRFLVLMHRVPFSGLELETLKEKGVSLNLTDERIRQLEESAYSKLEEYLRKEVELRSLSGGDILKLRIDLLPWNESSPYFRSLKARALNAFEEHFGFMPTCVDVKNLFQELARQKRPLLIAGLGRYLGQTTYEVFRRVGVELYQVEIR